MEPLGETEPKTDEPSSQIDLTPSNPQDTPFVPTSSDSQDTPFVPTTEYKDASGQAWEFDQEKMLWLPKVDEELIASQQAAYDTSKPKSTRKRKRPAKSTNKNNTTVYFSNLPTNIKEVDFFKFASKAGVIKKDDNTGAFMMNLYKDEKEQLKGDGLVTYLHKGSIQLAKTILDGDQIPNYSGYVVHVEEAKSKKIQKKPKPAGPIIKKKKKRKVINQYRNLGWEDWETRKHVILKNMFSPSDAAGDENFYIDLKADVKEETEKIGPVEVVQVFDGNPEGVIAIKFKESEDAERCIELMNGRWFSKKQISAEWYDGFSNYKVFKESTREEEERIDAFGDWLDNQSSSSDEEEED